MPISSRIVLTALALFAIAHGRAEEPAAFDASAAMIAETVGSISADAAPAELKRSNADVYLRTIDRAIGILDSAAPTPRKQAQLYEISRLVRDFRNVRDGEYAAQARTMLGVYDGWIAGEHFTLLKTSLLSVRLAAGAFL